MYYIITDNTTVNVPIFIQCDINIRRSIRGNGTRNVVDDDIGGTGRGNLAIDAGIWCTGEGIDNAIGVRWYYNRLGTATLKRGALIF